MIVNCQNIKAYHGAQLVLEDVNLDIRQGERIGLIGRNGSGKSTLLQLIAGRLRPDAGQLAIRKGTDIGYLTQIPAEFEGRTVYDVLALGHQELLECRLKMTELEKLMSEPDAADGPDRLAGWLQQYAALQEKFEREGGYELDAAIERVADGLRIDRGSYTQAYATLSGGEKTRINLASQLIRKPELLLLDEPTNHLDLHGVEWLEDYLTQYDGSCLIVSHDRYFLDRVVTKIVELEDGESQSYLTNYTGYMKEKEARLLQQFADYQEQQKKIKKMTETIKQLETWGRIGDNGKFFRRAASMQKALDRMEKLKRPALEAKSADFGLTQADRSGRKVVTLEGIGKSYGSRKLLDAIDGALAYGDKVMLIGKNGAGKSTLFKLILGEETADEGRFEWGARVDIGYLAQQEYPDAPKKSVLDYFRSEAGLEEGEARGVLAKYLFYGPDVFKSVNLLSGGEWTRMRLALLVLRKPNLLLLDEPTNHLDIASREALEEALETFPGTVLAISHDRYFINRMAGRIWELDNGRITVYLGNFDEYQEKRKQRENTSENAAVQGRSAAPPAVVKAKPAAQRRPSGSGKPADRRQERDTLERSIAQAEERLAALDAAMQEQEAGTDAHSLSEQWAEREAVQEELDRLYEQWLAAGEEQG
ncbi:ATPase components of ABC transporters with duplicated ATPase domains [Paenibacillus tianmuensis]|uniref:ATPase components of ABC transporters with duplicated ATPase domains n=1 Tax=Paenibacillus tianmuensis TaxID=624147 RepID=A0A1G4TUC2_9BACL|nr:ABC-F type ribosomal protection protein [Paenibacillus tianmuensis]SCW84938.1 ATPase components of ABC transporters with duplicated ATPase domains [Paenibacillus tianmuensis]